MFAITLFEARGLRNVDPMARQDPYVQISLGGVWQLLRHISFVKRFSFRLHLREEKYGDQGWWDATVFCRRGAACLR
jgi:hypothetical protein